MRSVVPLCGAAVSFRRHIIGYRSLKNKHLSRWFSRHPRRATRRLYCSIRKSTIWCRPAG